MKLVAAVATPSISMLAMNPALAITTDADGSSASHAAVRWAARDTL